MRSHLTLILLAVSLAACQGAFDPVGTGNSGDDSSDDDSDGNPAPQVDAGGDEPPLTAAEQFDQKVKPLMTTAHTCYGCHANGSSFPNIGETYAEITAYSGGGGKMVGCTPAASMLSTKGPHAGDPWWTAEQKVEIDDFITKAASENCKPAAKPYFDEDLGRLVE